MNYDTIKVLNLEFIKDRISELDLFSNGRELKAYLKLKREDINCPYCHNDKVYVKDYRNRNIVHSVFNNKKTIIVYKERRYICKECNQTFNERNYLTKGRENVSDLTKIYILEALMDHTATFTSVSNKYFVSLNTVINIFDKSIHMKRGKLPNAICMDEFYRSKTSDYKYAFVMIDFHTSKVIDVYESRQKFRLTSYFESIPKYERDNVKYISIDMYDTYKDLSHLYFRNALVGIDSFHVIKHLNEYMTKIRIKIMKKYDKNTDTLIRNDMYYYMLKKFHYFFTKDFDHIYNGLIVIPKMNHIKWDKYQILEYLLSIDKDLREAYNLKEKYRDFNKTATYDTCDNELDYLIDDFYSSKFDEFNTFGKMIKHYRNEIKNSFIRIDKRRLSSGPIEGVNNRIKTIIKSANGCPNFTRLRNRIIYSINKDKIQL